MEPELPGADLVARGIADLATGRLTREALLVLVGRPRLEALGVLIPPEPAGEAAPEMLLYELLTREHGDGAHSAYNALIRRLVSYERALELASG